MTIDDFSSQFEVLATEYLMNKRFMSSEFPPISWNEYEKSVWLTIAQEIIVDNLYDNGVEITEAERSKLLPLIVTTTITPSEASDSSSASFLAPDSSGTMWTFSLPDDLRRIILMRGSITNNTCLSGNNITLRPVRHDQWNHIINDPFIGPSKYKAIYVTSSDNNVEVYSSYDIGTVFLRYLKNPSPIILSNLLADNLNIHGETAAVTSELPEQVHEDILQLAVRMAIQTLFNNTENKYSKSTANIN